MIELVNDDDVFPDGNGVWDFDVELQEEETSCLSPADGTGIGFEFPTELCPCMGTINGLVPGYWLMIGFF